MNQPTPKDIKKALRKWVPRSKLSFASGWKTRGRPWSYGIRGVMVHHWAGTGDGGQTWMEARDGAYPYCNNVIRSSPGRWESASKVVPTKGVKTSGLTIC